MRYDDLAPAHMAAVGLSRMPRDYVGFAACDGDDVRAIALVYMSTSGHWWAAFRAFGACPPSVHKHALGIRDGLMKAGVKEVFAHVDETIPRALIWMDRLGFEPYRDDMWRLSFELVAVGRRTDRFRRDCINGGQG